MIGPIIDGWIASGTIWWLFLGLFVVLGVPALASDGKLFRIAFWTVIPAITLWIIVSAVRWLALHPLF